MDILIILITVSSVIFGLYHKWRRARAERRIAELTDEVKNVRMMVGLQAAATEAMLGIVHKCQDSVLDADVIE